MILSSSPRVLGSTAKEMAGMGYFTGAKVTRRSLAQSESPVCVSLSFMTAAMSPAWASSAFTCSLPRR